jgi:Family of unknown function (DUF5937)
VPIRFHIPAFAVERLSFAYSPLVEAVLSLHVLVEPKHHPLQHEFVRRMRSLPAPLRRRIGELAFVYRRTMPDFFAPSPDEGYGSFHDELRASSCMTTRRSRSSSCGRSTTTGAAGTRRS